MPSIEIANALLATALKRRETLPDDDLKELLARTGSIENRLLEDKAEVDIVTASGSSTKRSGWCSDRAPSRNRVDSWITVQALAFFLRRLLLLRVAKRSDVLTRYSWVPSGRCRPKWDEIVDPDDALETPPLKERILSAVNADISTRDRSPVFLLYGPPGTSKTSLVQGVAALKGWDLLTLSPSDFIADSLDHIEQQARTIFQDLMNLDHCVVLMDEMDALLRDRELLSKRGAGSIIEFVVPALLPKLQQLRDYVLRRHMAVFFVSNYYETIDRAIVRGGRIDNHILVLQYGRDGQRELVRRFLDKKGRPDLLDSIMDRLGALPCRFVYRDIKQIVNTACLAAPGATVFDLGSTLEHGIQPEVYRAKDRPDAFREAYAFAARLQNSPYGLDHVVTRPEAKVFFEASATTLADLQQFFSGWATQISSGANIEKSCWHFRFGRR